MKETIKNFKKSTPIEKFAMIMVIPVIVILALILPLPIEAYISIILLCGGLTFLTMFLFKKQIKKSSNLKVGDEVYTRNGFTGTIKGFDKNEDGLEIAIIETKIPKHILNKKNV